MPEWSMCPFLARAGGALSCEYLDPRLGWALSPPLRGPNMLGLRIEAPLVCRWVRATARGAPLCALSRIDSAPTVSAHFAALCVMAAQNTRARDVCCR